jgi:hypothetical protein
VEESDRVCHVSESGERIELNIVITFFIDNFFLQVFVRGVETLVTACVREDFLFANGTAWKRGGREGGIIANQQVTEGW